MKHVFEKISRFFTGTRVMTFSNMSSASLMDDQQQARNTFDLVSAAAQHPDILKQAQISPQKPYYKQVWKESKEIIKLGWPLVLAYLLYAAMGTISLYFVGNLNDTHYLAAAALGSTLANITCYAVLYGMVSPLETLASQQLGYEEQQKGERRSETSNAPNPMGVIFFRTLFVMFLTCIPIALLWTKPGLILGLFGQKEELIALTESYTQSLIPMIPLVALYETLKRYWTIVGKGGGPMIWMVYGIVVSLIMNLILVRPTGLGWKGVGIAVWSGYLATNVTGLIHSYLTPEIWNAWKGGLSKEVFHDLGSYFRLAIPGTVMTCCEWWAFEVCALIAGKLGTVSVASHSIVQTFTYSIYMIPYGLNGPISVCVGRYLGAGNSERARTSAHAALAIFTASMAVNAIVLMSARYEIGKWFSGSGHGESEEANSSRDEVIQLVSELVPIVSAYQIFDGMGICGGAILRGIGRPAIGAGITLMAYYSIGIPSSILLAFEGHMGVKGLWLGIAIAITVLGLAMMFAVYKIDWKQEAEKAFERAQKQSQKESGDSGPRKSLNDVHIVAGNGDSLDQIVKSNQSDFTEIEHEANELRNDGISHRSSTSVGAANDAYDEL